MAAVTFKDQPRAITEAGALLPGASLRLTLTGTDTDQPAYNNPELTTPLPNPLTADGAARFPLLCFDPAVEYRARLYHPDTGALVWDVDPLGTFPLSDSGIPLDDTGEPMPLSVLTFWRSQTTQLQDVFTSSALTTPLDNPLTSDSDGEFPAIYLDDVNEYRTRLETATGVLVYDADPYQYLQEIVSGAVVIDESAPSSGGNIGDDGDIGNLDYMDEPLLSQWQAGEIGILNVTADGEWTLHAGDAAGWGPFDAKPALTIFVWRDDVTINIDTSLLSIIGRDGTVHGGDGGNAIVLYSGNPRTGITLNITNQVGADVGVIAGGAPQSGLFAQGNAVLRFQCAGTTNILSGAGGISGVIE